MLRGIFSSIAANTPEIIGLKHVANAMSDCPMPNTLRSERLDTRKLSMYNSRIFYRQKPMNTSISEIHDKEPEKIAPPKQRSGSSVSSYLILTQNNQVLLGLRKNTGYNDGLWSLVAGHVEDGESATAAMIREAREEIGIELSQEQMKVVHIMHRRSNRRNIDVFFVCSSWEGNPRNCELEKCETLKFFPLDALPSNTIDYNGYVLSAMAKGEFYSEHGWS
jgi:8-oxo-dGTP pyrophosphatase MutT (NUDIX family)